MRYRLKLPSPGTAIGMVALVAALGGTAVALPGKNKVDKNDIKKNAVASKQVKNNSLTGTDVNESRLGKVPSAASADSATRANSAGTADSAGTANTATNATNATNAATAANALAVGGKGVASFEMVVEDDDPSEEVEIGDFLLTANCPSGEPNLDLQNDSFGNLSAASQGVDSVQDDFFESANGLTPTNSMSVTTANAQEGAGTVSLVHEDGRSVSMTFAYNDEGPETNASCHYYGTYVAG